MSDREELSRLGRRGPHAISCPDCTAALDLPCLDALGPHPGRVRKASARRRRLLHQHTTALAQVFKDRLPAAVWTEVADNAVAADWDAALDLLLASLYHHHTPVTAAEVDQLTFLAAAIDRNSRHLLDRLSLANDTRSAFHTSRSRKEDRT